MVCETKIVAAEDHAALPGTKKDALLAAAGAMWPPLPAAPGPAAAPPEQGPLARGGAGGAEPPGGRGVCIREFRTAEQEAARRIFYDGILERIPNTAFRGLRQHPRTQLLYALLVGQCARDPVPQSGAGAGPASASPSPASADPASARGAGSRIRGVAWRDVGKRGVDRAEARVFTAFPLSVLVASQSLPRHPSGGHVMGLVAGLGRGAYVYPAGGRSCAGRRLFIRPRRAGLSSHCRRGPRSHPPKVTGEATFTQRLRLRSLREAGVGVELAWPVPPLPWGLRPASWRCSRSG